MSTDWLETSAVSYRKLLTVNVGIFWYVANCGPNVNWRLGETHHVRVRGMKSAEHETSTQRVAGQIGPKPAPGTL
jgi:hypothetical protein